MSPSERQTLIATYGNAHQELLAALAEFPRAMWQFRPAPDLWTIHEIVVHITDSEANSYVRCRRLIAEPGSTVLGYDEVGWARVLQYHDQSVEDALELFKWLRLKSFFLIQTLPAAMWGNTVTHTENGLMTLDDWLVTYTRHIPDHIDQMRGVYAAWQAAPQA